jgi:hypothetical protein
MKTSSFYAVDAWTGPYCTSECQNDSDCQGEMRDSASANDGRCRSGYACGIAYVVGPLCCKKVCLCREFRGQVMLVPMTCDPSLSLCADSTTNGSTNGGVTIITPALPPTPAPPDALLPPALPSPFGDGKLDAGAPPRQVDAGSAGDVPL